MTIWISEQAFSRLQIRDKMSYRDGTRTTNLVMACNLMFLYSHYRLIGIAHQQATKPICKIVGGYFTIAAVVTHKPSEMWRITHKGSGISKEYFDAYFNGCDKAHAIIIGEAFEFEEPIDPKEVIKDFHAPQNFMYVDYDI